MPVTEIAQASSDATLLHSGIGGPEPGPRVPATAPGSIERLQPELSIYKHAQWVRPRAPRSHRADSGNWPGQPEQIGRPLRSTFDADALPAIHAHRGPLADTRPVFRLLSESDPLPALVPSRRASGFTSTPFRFEFVVR
uniref:Uncharacterized protein n=1 Tax=Mycena chlorophos TaxID=658473 RepID=A0ABQ0M3W3_MYCCL|nr:predicted protein [Mycena chlorophos]